MMLGGISNHEPDFFGIVEFRRQQLPGKRFTLLCRKLRGTYEARFFSNVDSEPCLLLTFRAASTGSASHCRCNVSSGAGAGSRQLKPNEQ